MTCVWCLKEASYVYICLCNKMTLAKQKLLIHQKLWLELCPLPHLPWICLQVISSVTGNKSCVSNIADSNVLQYLLLVLHMLPACESIYCLPVGMVAKGCFLLTAEEMVLEVLQALTSNTQIVKEMLHKGLSSRNWLCLWVWR